MKHIKISWNSVQKKRLQKLLNEQKKTPDSVWIGYWNSDQFGRPNNGGNIISSASPGIIHNIKGELEICSNGLHATKVPHQWQGCRIWIVALLGNRIDEKNKSAGIRREIIGEVLPEECLDDRIGVKIGRKDLSGADLGGANLSRANLNGANLSGANLYRAHLNRANLSRANLNGANLSGANLYRAYLSGADLSGANLNGANLSGADLSGANLNGANLRGAYLGSDIRPEWLPEIYSIKGSYIILD